MRSAIVAAVFGLLATPTLASAHAGNNDPNVVHACISRSSQVVCIIGVSGSCIASPVSKAETPAHWEIRGPQGPPGANGTNGTNGIDGTSVTVLGTFSGAENGCPNGGTILGTANGNAYVCNGPDATGATNPDAPCFDNTNRYVNCGNGTVTDTVTGLIWLTNASCVGTADWAQANQAAAGLSTGQWSLTDNSSPGDWRLPTRDEWSATIAQAFALGCYNATAPTLTNDAGTGCLSAGPSSFAGVASDYYWSSPTNASAPTNALTQFLVDGGVYGLAKSNGFRVWPVRGGRR